MFGLMTKSQHKKLMEEKEDRHLEILAAQHRRITSSWEPYLKLLQQDMHKRDTTIADLRGEIEVLRPFAMKWSAHLERARDNFGKGRKS